MRVFIYLLKAWWRCDIVGSHRPVTRAVDGGLQVRCGDCTKWGA